MQTKTIVLLILVSLCSTLKAQFPLSNYLDSLLYLDSLKSSKIPNSVKRKRIVEDSLKNIKMQKKSVKVDSDTFDFKPRKRDYISRNRILIPFPFRSNPSIAMCTEFRPTFERDLNDYISIYFSPTIYYKKISGNYRGGYDNDWYSYAINIPFYDYKYLIDGWGQNYGIKFSNKRFFDDDLILSLDLAYQVRDIRIYGQSAPAETDAYHDAVMNKEVKDGRLRLLLNFEFSQDSKFLYGFYFGSGYPLWGKYTNHILKTSGNRADEWRDGNKNNVIVMRHFDLYLGAFIGLKFSDFWNKSNE